jgi:GH15 family glucan-1,4-alpha-glucosidase
MEKTEAPKSHTAANGYKPIEDYGVIGDLHTMALVGRDGSIDWCCLPQFDSPSVFAALLDRNQGGFFRIAPVQAAVRKQMYFPETCILLTRFMDSNGVSELIDFMIPDAHLEPEHIHQIVRRVRCVRGEVKFQMDCFPAFDYARAKHTLLLTEEGAVFESSKCIVGLTSPTELKRNRDGVSAEFSLRPGQEITFLLRHVNSGSKQKPLEPNYDAEQAFYSTTRYWQEWLAACRYQGRWREMVQRSALTLKLLTFAPTGAIVAAPTASLPEVMGGSRNWDYRYTWIRDAAFTVYAFIRLGLLHEAEQFMKWIDDRAHEEEADGSLQIMYSVDGKHELDEEELTHLEGYKGSRPVRIGNAAYKQLQLDIYGELMDSVYLSNKYVGPISYDIWTHLRLFLNYVCDNWSRPDEGIWEVRGGRHHFVYSKLMCWVALDRGLRLAQKRSLPADNSRWLSTRDAIYEEIMTKGWNPGKKCFVQHYDTDALDASNLIMPLVLFISPNDPRMQGTLDATMRTLVSDSLVHRYEIGRGAVDGFTSQEGTFSICSFWLVEALTRAGRLQESRLIFEKMHSYANHVGLYSEQIGPTGEALGNFPQAFTHLSLISAAFNLDRALNRRGSVYAAPLPKSSDES